MSKGDLGRPLRGNVTLYREPAIRCFAKWCSDMCLYGLAHLLHYMAHAVGGSRWWRCDLWCIICMSSSAWLERKQWASHRQTAQKNLCVYARKQQRKKQWSMCPARHLMPSQTCMKTGQRAVGPMQIKSIWCFYTPKKNNIHPRASKGFAEFFLRCSHTACRAALYYYYCHLFSAPLLHLTVASLKSWPALHVV